MRIRWRGVAKVVAILVVGLIAVRLLPGFLRAPEPPPLAADVGLPKATPVTAVPRGGAAKPVTDVPGRLAADRPATRPPKQRRRSRPRKSQALHTRDAPPSRAVIGSKRRHPRPEKAIVESTPPPLSEYVPPPAPEPIPEPSPELRSTPGDGSQEFAPH